jgi:hypothetical protein
MPEFTVPLAGGGAMTVNASDAQAALENVVSQGGTPQGGTIAGGHMLNGPGNPPSGGGAPPSPGKGGDGGVTAADLDAQFQKMLAALASGNKEAFEFEKEKFNLQFQESKRQFDLGRSDELAKFEQQFGLAVGELTGVYNGAPTESARRFNQDLAQRQREFGANLGTTLLDAATRLRGPRDYLQYQQMTRGGQNLMQQLAGDQAIQQTGTPAGQLQSVQLGDVLGDIGFNPAAFAPNPSGQMAGQGMGILPGEGPLPGRGAGFTPEQLSQIEANLEQQIGRSNWKSAVFRELVAQGVPVDQAIRQAADTQQQYTMPNVTPTYQVPSVGGGRQPAYTIPPGESVSPPRGSGYTTGDYDWSTGIRPPSGRSAQGGYTTADYDWSTGMRLPSGRPAQGGFSAQGMGIFPGENNFPSRTQGVQADLLRRFGMTAGQQLQPHQINPARWDAMGQIGRDLTKNLAETAYGYDAEDFERQLNATRPMGRAPRRTMTTFSQPRGIY